jgi:hypothetical protein
VLVEDGNGQLAPSLRLFSQGFADWVQSEAQAQNLLGKLRDHLKTRK